MTPYTPIAEYNHFIVLAKCFQYWEVADSYQSENTPCQQLHKNYCDLLTRGET